MQGEHVAGRPASRGQYSGFPPGHLAHQMAGRSDSVLHGNDTSQNESAWTAGTPRSRAAATGNGLTSFQQFSHFQKTPFSGGADYNSNSEGSPRSTGSGPRFRNHSQELRSPALSVQGVGQSRPSTLRGPTANGSSHEPLQARACDRPLEGLQGQQVAPPAQQSTPTAAPAAQSRSQWPEQMNSQHHNLLYGTDLTPMPTSRHPPPTSSIQHSMQPHAQAIPHHLQPPQQPNFNASTPPQSHAHPNQHQAYQQQPNGETSASSSRPVSRSQQQAPDGQNMNAQPQANSRAQPSLLYTTSDGDLTPQSSRQPSPGKLARRQQPQQKQPQQTAQQRLPQAGPSVANVGELFAHATAERRRHMHGSGHALTQQGLQTSLPCLPHAGPLLSGQHLIEAASQGPAKAAQLAGLPVQKQEQLVIQDLLQAFLGWSSSYALPQVRSIYSQRHVYFVFSQPQADASVVEVASRLLCLCEYVAVTESYCESQQAYQAGQVCQALTECLSNIVQSWRSVVTQLSTAFLERPFTLLDLHWHMEQYRAQLQVLAEVCGEAAHRKLHGAALLSYLHTCASACLGDDRKRRQLEVLAAAAAQPYFRALRLWLDSGRLHDPCAEFMVVRSQGAEALSSQDMQWDTEYTLRTLPNTSTYDLPSFLEDCKDSILVTGKYVLAKGSFSPAEQASTGPGIAVEYDVRGKFKRAIQEKHAAASAALMTQLRDQLGLGKLLKGAMDFLLLGRGDFLVTFLDATEEELLGPCPADASTLAGLTLSLQAELDNAVRATAQPGSEAMLASRIKVSVEPPPKGKAGKPGARTAREVPLLQIPGSKEYGVSSSAFSPRPADDRAGRPPRLHSQLALQLEVPWPLSVVINREAQQQHTVAFRHLFALKCADRRLCNAWRTLQLLRLLHGQERSNRGAVTALSHCNLQMHFVRLLLLFETFEVLEPLWRSLRTRLEHAQTLEEVLEHHAGFLRRLHGGWLLSRSEALSRAMEVVQASVHAFCDLIAEVEEAVDGGPGDSMGLPTPATGDKRSDLKVTHAIIEGGRRQKLLSIISDDNDWGRRLRSEKMTFDRSLKKFVQCLEGALQHAQRSETEAREDIDSMEAVLDRLRAGFMATQKNARSFDQYSSKVQAMKQHSLPEA